MLTLSALSRKLGYSEDTLSRKFKEISGMHFRDYLRQRSLAFALKEVRDSKKRLLEIALDYGFSSHEAFSRSFKEAYGVTPSQYRADPKPVALRTILRPFDCYLISAGGTGMEQTQASVTGISGKGRAAFLNRTARPSAAFSPAYRANWTIWAVLKTTAAAAN